MRPPHPPDGQCPQAGQTDRCNLTCKYNYFEAGDLVINSWELKCLDCGWRQTIAYRTDDEDETPPENPKQCPFCGVCDLPPGRNPCDHNA